MKKVILLYTDWEEKYWEFPKEAPYPGREYTQLPEWDETKKNLPLPGLGIYSKFKKQDLSEDPFVYIRVDGMRYDENSKQPYFSFTRIERSKTKSFNLSKILPSEAKKLFSGIDAENLMEYLTQIGETPPKEWMDLIELKEMPIRWEDSIGVYFLDIERKNLSNNEFEDRIADLLKALSFKVKQQGHILQGEYPDGIFSFEDYAVVYDCKNTSNFSPSSADIRAIEKYLKDEKKVRKEKNIYAAFIAKSFRQQGEKNVFYFTVSSLIYLLYKKLTLGLDFTLNPIKKILENTIHLTKDIIDKEWRV